MIKRADQLLLIFIRNPIKGKVKTRLANSIGEEKALAIYLQLLKHTALITQKLPLDKFVFYDSYIDLNDSWDNEVYEKFLQEGNDLGEKMQNAFQTGFSMQYKSIVIIGSDCMELTEEIILNAFEQLKLNEVVVGPACDGGYYLLGMNQLYSDLFKGKNWSTSSVLNDTRQDIFKTNLAHTELPLLSDIDEVEDLNKFIDYLSWL